MTDLWPLLRPAQGLNTNNNNNIKKQAIAIERWQNLNIKICV